MNILISSLFGNGLRALGLPRWFQEYEIKEPEVNQFTGGWAEVFMLNFNLGLHFNMKLEGDVKANSFTGRGLSKDNQ